MLRSWKPILLFNSSFVVVVLAAAYCCFTAQLVVVGYSWGAASRRNSALLTVLREDWTTHCKLVPELCTLPSPHNTHIYAVSFLSSIYNHNNAVIIFYDQLSPQFWVYILFPTPEIAGEGGAEGGAGDPVWSVLRWRGEERRGVRDFPMF